MISQNIDCSRLNMIVLNLISLALSESRMLIRWLIIIVLMIKNLRNKTNEIIFAPNIEDVPGVIGKIVIYIFYKSGFLITYFFVFFNSPNIIMHTCNSSIKYEILQLLEKENNHTFYYAVNSDMPFNKIPYSSKRDCWWAEGFESSNVLTGIWLDGRFDKQKLEKSPFSHTSKVHSSWGCRISSGISE